MIRVVFGLALATAIVFTASAGDRAFRDGRFEDAATEYRRELERGGDVERVRFNLGTALLRLGRYDEAREHLARAATAAGPRVRSHAHFNAGNSDLEPAFRARPEAGRDEPLLRAIAHYREALLLDSSDLDAKWNLELAQRLLAQPTGGGGGGGEDDPQSGGGGGPEDDAPAQPDPSPAPGAGGGEAGMSRAEAERVLRAAAQRDRELQQDKLRRTERPPPNVRDW